MTRARVAVALAVVAALCLVGTAWVAVATYADRDSMLQVTRVVRDPGTGATFEVPREGWRVRRPDAPVSYGAAALAGAALFRPGYCRADPRGSFRAVAGVTEQDLPTWVRAVGGAASRTTRVATRLAGGTPATLGRASLRLPADRCSAGRVELTMVEAGDVRLLVLADAGGSGTLTRAGAERIARSLQLP